MIFLQFADKDTSFLLKRQRIYDYMIDGSKIIW